VSAECAFSVAGAIVAKVAQAESILVTVGAVVSTPITTVGGALAAVGGGIGILGSTLAFNVAAASAGYYCARDVFDAI
jgi:hypothetical protein